MSKRAGSRSRCVGLAVAVERTDGNGLVPRPPAAHALVGALRRRDANTERVELDRRANRDTGRRVGPARDGHAYVVKLANNPQSVRVLANEWLASSIGRALGLTIPEPAILYVPAKLVESSPSLVIRLSGSTLKCSHGLAFGSRVISGEEVFDYLPESTFARIENLQEFAGAFALDKWLCNCDGRQVVFCRREPNRNFRAHFIDFGYCFNAEEWNFPDTTTRGIYARRCV